ncbi:sodium/glutamate symporter [Paucibacter sp. PLA-PC-4]|uniref:sodium/glutamate symporter n=1 Tax=Paucibacter sp. PLA-PC-4 TaxID=2993655 RepID=UPI0022489067|nr:sodium/glutamate symporter [Paucibacter sp. PLA-PC-4]MCX2862547.1 sodium/glutamate symporter [Paucibacter sp. PLA-PC-4]
MSLDPLASLLAATVVLLIGSLLNRRIGLLSRYNIPDPITGGLLFAALASLVFAATDFRLEIDQTLKPVLLLMFFAGVGMCADLRMLGRGGRALVIFLLVLFPYILVQNGVGIAVALALDQHPIFGLVGGSITLVGGHGTGAAYAERFAEVNNLQSVMELSMTVATLGLIVGGIIAGPVAQYLIKRHGLRAAATAAAGSTRPQARHESEPTLNSLGMMGALAGILAAVVAGQWLAGRFGGGAVTIPSFLWCMVVGVAIRNLLPFAGMRLDDRASDLISTVCLSLFLVTTMMALNLVEVALSAGPFVLMIAAQVVFIVLYTVFVCFRFMGRDYEAAVSSAALIGFSMGSTATAMANMQAITARYGPAPQSYLIVPLAGAFFIDLMNAVVLTLTLPLIGG